jgi:hypothetical protein
MMEASALLNLNAKGGGKDSKGGSGGGDALGANGGGGGIKAIKQSAAAAAATVRSQPVSTNLSTMNPTRLHPELLTLNPEP